MLGKVDAFWMHQTYRECSGQLLNREKSVIFFRGNCIDTMKQEVCDRSGIAVEALVEKYLGLSCLRAVNRLPVQTHYYNHKDIHEGVVSQDNE